MELKATAQQLRVDNIAGVALSCLACLLMALLATGCHKSDAPAGQQTAPVADTTPTPAPDSSGVAPAPPSPAPNPNVTARTENAVQANVTGEVNEFLTQQLRIFIQQQGRLPQSFAEFARARLDNVPKPPPGTKWVIDSTSQQVEAVPSK